MAQENNVVNQLFALNEERQRENEELKRRVTDLEARVEAMSAKNRKYDDTMDALGRRETAECCEEVLLKKLVESVVGMEGASRAAVAELAKVKTILQFRKFADSFPEHLPHSPELPLSQSDMNQIGKFLADEKFDGDIAFHDGQPLHVKPSLDRLMTKARRRETISSPGTAFLENLPPDFEKAINEKKKKDVDDSLKKERELGIETPYGDMEVPNLPPGTSEAQIFRAFCGFGDLAMVSLFTGKNGNLAAKIAFHDKEASIEAVRDASFSRGGIEILLEDPENESRFEMVVPRAWNNSAEGQRKANRTPLSPSASVFQPRQLYSTTTEAQASSSSNGRLSAESPGR